MLSNRVNYFDSIQGLVGTTNKIIKAA